MTSQNANYARRIGYLNAIQRFNVMAFWATFLGSFGGVIVGVLGLESVATVAIVVGVSFGTALIAELIVVLPFVKCPACEAPFFKRPGIFYQLNPHHRSCKNCEMNLSDVRTADDR